MEKQFRLRKNYQFNYVYKNGKGISDKWLVMVFCKNKNNKPKIGFSISKKFGKAVKRNKMRRRLKDIVYNRYDNLDVRYNYIFLPRVTENQATFDQLATSVNYLIEKAKKVDL